MKKRSYFKSLQQRDRVDFLISKRNLNLNLDKFKSIHNFVLITGLSGSGKTTMASLLSKKHDAKIISLDGLGLIYKSKKINKETKECVLRFIEKYPVIKSELEGDFWHRQKLNNFEKYKEWNELFINFVIAYVSIQEDLFVIEGTQIFMTLKAREIAEFPIVILRSSGIRSFFRRMKRQLSFREFLNPYKGFKHLFKLVNDSRRLHIKDYRKLNKFIKELTIFV